jgi:Skp family chaperone for outer membrane proteins
MVDFVSTTNGNLKTSKSNLEKCFNAYWSKAKAHDDNLQNTIKAKANPKSKPRDIAKLDQRDQKSEEAYDAAAQTYEQQITLTNQLIYETYNNIYPSCFMVG